MKNNSKNLKELLDFLALSPLQQHSVKLNKLLDRIKKEFADNIDQKTVDFSSPLKTLLILKKTHEITTICFIELCNDLQLSGLDFLSIPFLKLFNLIKWEAINWIKFHNYFVTVRSTLERELLQDLDTFKKTCLAQIHMYKSQLPNDSPFWSLFGNNNINKFEKIEKARFFLEQEDIEISKLYNIQEKGQKEIDNFLLRTKENLKKVPIPKTKQYLLQVLKEMKGEKNVNEDFLEADQDFDIDFSVMKEELLSKLDNSSKKLLKSYLSRFSKKKNKIPEFLQELNSLESENNIVLENKEVQTDYYIDLDFTSDKNNAEITGVDLEILKNKERKMNEILKEKNKEIELIDLKSFRRKEKIKKLKEDNSKLEDKLDDFISKEINMKTKEKQDIFSKNKERFSLQNFQSKESEYKILLDEFERQNNEIKQENQELLDKNEKLEIKISQLQNILELYSSNEEFEVNQKQENFGKIYDEKNVSNKLNSLEKLNKENNNLKNISNINNKAISDAQITTDIKATKNSNQMKKDDISSKIISLDDLKEQLPSIYLTNLQTKKENLESLSKIDENINKEEQKPINHKKNIKEVTKKSKNSKKIINNSNQAKSPKEVNKISFVELTSEHENNLLSQIKQLQTELESFKKNPIKNLLKFLNFKDCFENSNYLVDFFKLPSQNIKNYITAYEENTKEKPKKITKSIETQTAIVEKKIEFFINEDKIKKEIDEIFIKPNPPEIAEVKPEIAIKTIEKDDFSKFQEKYYIRNPQPPKKNEEKISFPSIMNSTITENLPSNQTETTPSNSNQTKSKLTKITTNNSKMPKISKIPIDDLKAISINLDSSVEGPTYSSRVLSKIEKKVDLSINEEYGLEEMKNNITDRTHLKDDIDDDENFAKLKHFFKYPFKSVNGLRSLQDKEKQQEFNAMIQKVINLHKKCGPNCEHLRRFFKKIGFSVNGPKNKSIALSKTVFDKLPEI